MIAGTYWCSARACPFFAACPKSVLCAPEGLTVLYCCDLRGAEGCYSLRLQGEYLARMAARCVPAGGGKGTAEQERSDAYGDDSAAALSPGGQASAGC